jgi:Xaa-Pro aminopeptidase
VLTDVDDYLLMTPTTNGEHLNTTRRSTWVTHLLPLVERAEWPRVELWDIRQIPAIFARLGLSSARLGFELGDCTTLGLTVNDFLALRELMTRAELVDGSSVIRALMSVHTPLEIDRVRLACQAGVWIYDQMAELLRPGQTERALIQALTERFASRYGAGYAYRADGFWDVRNPTRDDANLFHAAITDRVYQRGDYVARGYSGVSYRGYPGDIDRGWQIGPPTAEVERYYQITWECNQAMAEAIRPGARCCDIYAAGAAVERRHGLPERVSGRTGHGIRNTGGLSVFPGNQTILEPGMIISVEPMFATDHGWFDLEDQYLVTETGREILHAPAPAVLPVIAS